jgi:hypothetical protein
MDLAHVYLALKELNPADMRGYFPICTVPSLFNCCEGAPVMGANGKGAPSALDPKSQYASPLRTGNSRIESALFRTTFPRPSMTSTG